MATGTPGSTARQYVTQQVHYLRRGVTHADNGKTVDVGTLPAGALLLKGISGVYVNVAFNGDTTNTLDIGRSTDSGTNDFATVLALGAIAFVPLDEAVSQLVTSDTLIQAKVVSSASASAGEAEIVIAYIPDNDR